MKYIGAFLFDIVVMLVAPFAYAYDCADGYVLSNNVVTNFTAPLAGSCNGLYALTSDMFYVINDDPIKCGPNSYLSGSTCVSLSGGDCASGYNQSVNVVTNFTAPLAGGCSGLYAWSSNMVYAINSASTKCGPGSYPTADGCETWTGDADCPTNYYVPTNPFARPDSSGACASGAQNDTIFDYCRTQLGESSPDLCTPQRSCTASPAFHAAGGHSWPLFMDKATNPSMGFKIGSDVCYMNLLLGRETNNLNIKDQNENIYHGVK